MRKALKNISNQFVLFGLGKCRETIDSVITQIKIADNPDRCFEIRLIITEALTNAFKHGNKNCVNKPIYLRYTYNNKSIRFEIEDAGKGFKNVVVPEQISSESSLNDYGRGLFLINSVADRIDLKNNTIIIEKNLTNK